MYYILYTMYGTLLISVSKIAVDGTLSSDAHMPRISCGPWEKRLNWSDYLLVYKEIATSISWCTYVTIILRCTRIGSSITMRCARARDMSLSTELMRDWDWDRFAIDMAIPVFKTLRRAASDQFNTCFSTPWRSPLSYARINTRD